MVKIAVVGSRSFRDVKRMEEILNELLPTLDAPVIVTGGAMGADTLAEQYAHARGIPCLVFKADWDKYGRAAGYIRNIKMAEEADRAVAFWDGKSRGTAHMIRIMRERKKPVEVVLFTEGG